MISFLLDVFSSKQWRPCAPYTSVDLIDGSTAPPHTYVMRRRIKGGWEYRACTSSERADAEWMDAIR